METINDLGAYTFKALLENSVRKFPDRPALALIDSTPITYQELYTKTQQYAKMFTALGLKKGCKVAIYAGGRPEWGISYFALNWLGIIAVPLLPDFCDTEVKSILEHCIIDAFISEEKLLNKLTKISESLPKTIIDIKNMTILEGEYKGKNPLDFNSIPLPIVKISEDDTASIIYTSGTTGRSKGVELSNKNLIWSAISGQYCHRINKYDKCVSFLPLSHVYEFTIGFTMEMLNGACVYYLGKPPVVSALLPAFSKIQPSIIISVPLIMEKIYKNKILPIFQKNLIIKELYKIPLIRKILNRQAGKQLKKTFGGHLVFFGIGGAKIDPIIEQFMKEAKFPYAIGYGLTETSPLLAGSGPRITKPGTIGPLIPDLDIKLLNMDKDSLVGEIVVKGPNVMKSYYKEPELTKATFTTKDDSCGEGYFKTGDLGRIELRRNIPWLSLMGRSKNMILGSNGENIYPEDIEFVLNQHPLVSESLVVEDDNGLVALVQVDEEKIKKEAETRSLKDRISELTGEIQRDATYYHAAILNEIQFFVNSRVNKSSKIDRVQFVKEFEKTASQKIKRYLYDLRTKVNAKKKDK